MGTLNHSLPTPLAQNYTSFRSLQLRCSVPPESLIPAVQSEIRRLAPDLPIFTIGTMRQLIQGLAGLFIFRLAASLAGIMGILGLLLAVMGVYGVVSYAANQRTREIGIRMALGAGRSDILRLISRQGLRQVIVGIVCWRNCGGGSNAGHGETADRHQPNRPSDLCGGRNPSSRRNTACVLDTRAPGRCVSIPWLCYATNDSAVRVFKNQEGQAS